MHKLINDFTKISRRVAEAVGAYNALISQKTSYIAEVISSNEYVENKDKILDLLLAAKNKLQEKDIESIERVLTSFINDVIPKNNDKVVIKSKAENNRLSLDIFVEEDGKERNVFDDKGGSIQNLISIGLRLITLSRSRNRRFVVFDEADQGIKTEYIPRLAQLLCELSKKMGIQILYISHHDTSCFHGSARIIELSLNKHGEVKSALAQESDGDDDTKEHFEELRIKNFRRHKSTVMSLSPNLNIITGDNDIGKSTIVEAITAITENKVPSSCLRDDCVFQSVELVDNNGFVFQWLKNKEKKGGVEFTLSDDNGDLIQTDKSVKGTPSWWHDFMLMKQHCGENIHISRQFKSHFIIGNEMSGKDKAEMLSFGSDLRKVSMMVTLHGQKVREHQQIIRSRKADIDSVSRKIQSLMTLINQESEVESLKVVIEKIKKRHLVIDKVTDFDNKLNVITTNVQQFNYLLKLTELLNKTDRLDTTSLKSFRAHLKELMMIERSLSSANVDDDIPDDIGRVDLRSYNLLLSFVINSRRTRSTRERLDSMVETTSYNFDNGKLSTLSGARGLMNDTESQLSAANAQLTESQKGLESAKKELEQFIKNEMKSCPACGREDLCTH